ncbi:MAG: glycosyltransferase family 4 protein [Candidatus Aminicenantales bacterium]
MRNILFVSHSAELSGAEQWLLHTLGRINRDKFRPFLVLPRSGPLEAEMKKLGIETNILSMKWWLTRRAGIWKQPLAWIWNIRGIFRLVKMIREKEIDLVFSNSAANCSGALAAKKSGVPHIWAVHEILRGERPLLHFLFGSRCLVRWIHSLSSRVIVNSLATQRAFGELDRVSLVYNGIDIPEEDRSPSEALKEEWGVQKGDVVLGIIGKIYKGKGQRELIQVTALLSSRFSGLKLLVVGSIGDRGYYRRLERLVRRLGLGDRVKFTGFRKDLMDLLKLMDVLVVASLVESFGRVVLHAMAAGTPVLAVKSGGIPEIIRHGENGFLMDSRDPEVLAASLEDILRNRERIEAVVRKGLQTVREQFTLDRQIELIEQALAGCLGGE